MTRQSPLDPGASPDLLPIRQGATDSDRLDRIVMLLEALCKHHGARLPARAKAPAEMRQWREVGRSLGQIHRPAEDSGEYPSSTTTPERFWRKEE